MFHHQKHTDDSAITVYQENLNTDQYTSSNRQIWPGAENIYWCCWRTWRKQI